MSTVLITGAATGIGALTARTLARSGHEVFASMRDPDGRNARAARALRDDVRDAPGTIRTVELDVTSQESVDEAVATVLTEVDSLDVVVQNAGHLALGYTEAFPVEEVARLFDVNAFSVQRVNRAVLPHLRGTEHFPSASRASDTSVTAAYAKLDPLVDRYEAATEGLFAAGTDPDPVSVAEEIARILALPRGQRPFRSVVDFTQSDVEAVNEVNRASAVDFLTRMGYEELLLLPGRPSADPSA